MHNICVCISAEYEFLDSCKYFLVLIHQKKKKHTQKNKKQKKIPQSHGSANVIYIFKRIVFLKAELPTKLTKVLQLSIFMNKLLILMFGLRYLYTCCKKKSLHATKLEVVSHQRLENESYHWCR